MKISPITEVELKINILDILELEETGKSLEFDYSKAAQEFFDSFKGETCRSFVEELIKVLQNDLDQSNKSLERITAKYIQFKTKEELRREQIRRNIIENTKSF